MSRTVTIIGCSAMPISKIQSKPGSELEVMEHEVMVQLVVEAVRKAGIDKNDIGALSFAIPRPYTLQKYFATFMAAYLRLTCRGTVCESLGNGMTGGLAFEAAANDILLGRSRVALALGVNFESAVPAAEHMMSSMRTVGDVDFQAPFGVSPIAWAAMDAVRYMHETGATRAEIASVAVKNRRHAAHNALAQYRTPITVEDVLAQPPIVEPLGLYDVPPRGDGAVCLVLAEEEVARTLGKPYVRVRARGYFHEGLHIIDDCPGDMTRFPALEAAAASAFEEARIKPADLDFAELYSACTIIEILLSEGLGLAPRGAGAKWAAEGRTALGGTIPISTSGGLTSRGHPAYVTPLYSFVEAFEQLLGLAGERQVGGARLGLTSAELGNYNAALLHVLEGVH